MEAKVFDIVTAASIYPARRQNGNHYAANVGSACRSTPLNLDYLIVIVVGNIFKLPSCGAFGFPGILFFVSHQNLH